jgi:hypothetical protein
MVQLRRGPGRAGFGWRQFLGVASASVADLFPESAERLRWQAYMSAAYGLAMAVGPWFARLGVRACQLALCVLCQFADCAAGRFSASSRPCPREGAMATATAGSMAEGAALLAAAVCGLLFSAEQSQAHGLLAPIATGLWVATVHADLGIFAPPVRTRRL